MNSKTVLLSSLWLLSLPLGYMVGSKAITPKDETANHNSDSTSYRTSSRLHRSSSSGNKSQNLELEFILMEGNPTERTTRLLAMFKDLDSNNFEQLASDFINSGLEGNRDDEYKLLLHAWTKVDPLAALEFQRKYDYRNKFYNTILASWAEYDPDAALHWVKNNKHRNGKEYPLAGIIRGIAVSDLQRATEIFHTIQNSTDRHYSLLAIIPYIAKQGPNQANEWVKNIKDQEFRSKAAKEIIKLLTRQDPKTAAQWVLSENRALIPAVAGEWAKSDLTSAIAWTERLQNYEKDTAAESIIAEYSIQDLEQASQWINNFTESSTYPSMVDQFAKTAFFSNRPELALSKIATIKNTSKHNRSQKYILSRWYSKNPTAAAVWMDNQNISHKTREKVISHSKAYP